MAVGSLAISAGSAVLGMAASRKQASVANTTGVIQQKQTEQAAQRDFVLQDQELSARQVQEQDAAATQKFDNTMAARKAVATNMVAAGESGVAGSLSTMGLLRDIYQQNGMANDRINQQTDWTMQEIQNQKKSANSQKTDKIILGRFQPMARPNFADTGLKIASSAINSYSNYRQWSA
jgi:hypothetical protein